MSKCSAERFNLRTCNCYLQKPRVFCLLASFSFDVTVSPPQPKPPGWSSPQPAGTYRDPIPAKCIILFILQTMFTGRERFHLTSLLSMEKYPSLKKGFLKTAYQHKSLGFTGSLEPKFWRVSQTLTKRGSHLCLSSCRQAWSGKKNSS